MADELKPGYEFRYSVFTDKEREDFIAKEHTLVLFAKAGDHSGLFDFWAEKKSYLLARCKELYEGD